MTAPNEYADPATGIADENSAYAIPTNPETIAAIKNATVTAGPACNAASCPGKIKIPVPITAPIPSDNKSLAPRVLVSLESAFKYVATDSFLKTFFMKIYPLICVK